MLPILSVSLGEFIGLFIGGMIFWGIIYILEDIAKEFGPQIKALLNFLFEVFKMVLTLLEWILKLLGMLFKGFLYGFNSIVKSGSEALNDMNERAIRRKQTSNQVQRDEGHNLIREIYNAYIKTRSGDIEGHIELDSLKHKYGQEKINEILVYLYRLENSQEDSHIQER